MTDPELNTLVSFLNGEVGSDKALAELLERHGFTEEGKRIRNKETSLFTGLLGNESLLAGLYRGFVTERMWEESNRWKTTSLNEFVANGTYNVTTFATERERKEFAKGFYRGVKLACEYLVGDDRSMYPVTVVGDSKKVLEENAKREINKFCERFD